MKKKEKKEEKIHVKINSTEFDKSNGNAQKQLKTKEKKNQMNYITYEMHSKTKKKVYLLHIQNDEFFFDV